MKNTVRKKFATVCFLLVFITSIAVFCITWFLFDREGEGSMRYNQRIIAELMLDMTKSTNYSTDEIIHLCVHNPFTAVITSQTFPDDIYQPSVLTKERNSIYVRVHDVWVQIYFSHHTPFVIFSLLGLFAMGSIAILLGTLFAGIISGRMVRPIDALIDATDKIAKGDFSVRVRVPREQSLQQLVNSFNIMAHDLSGIESLRVDFMNDVSHEFKTPLSSIHGFAKLLQKENLPEAERIEYANIIAMETKRLVALSSDILHLSRLENQVILTGKALFSLDEQIRQVIVSLESAWSIKNIDMNVELETIQYLGNEELLRRIWCNLIENAIKFTNDGGQVSVRMIDAEDAVIVRIKDTGIGMDTETLQHIYKKFYQGNASHAGTGVGLGLPLAKRVVELCNGDITVKSEKGHGTTFRVTLPIEKSTP